MFPCSNETRALIANPPNRAQLGDTPTIPPRYIRVCAQVWALATDRHRHTWTDRHTDARDQVTLRVIYDSRET